MKQISKYQGKFDTHDLELLRKYARGKQFLIETGTGVSTHYIAEGINGDNAVFYTIDINPTPEDLRVPSGVKYLKGWSIRWEDFIQPDDPRFVKSQYRSVDSKVLLQGQPMNGERDLVRKVLKKHPDMQVDFYFSDCGEYCGYPEWLIIRDHIIPGGIFAAHDIYYPKSIKNFKVVEEIEKSPDWMVLEKTSTKQGMFIAMKIPNRFVPMDNFDPPIFMYDGIRKDSMKKEPGTIAWASKLGKGVLFDVGANVGAYSLVAARANPDLQIFAFEPMFANYYALVQNVITNQLVKQITPICCGIAEIDGFAKFNVRSVKAGTALSSLGPALDYHGEPFIPEFVQCVCGFSIDSLVQNYGFPSPDFVKIDVDSIETEIVRGMAHVLQEVQSVLIEGDTRQFAIFDPVFRKAGFTMVSIEKHPLTNNYIYSRD